MSIHFHIIAAPIGYFNRIAFRTCELESTAFRIFRNGYLIISFYIKLRCRVAIAIACLATALVLNLGSCFTHFYTRV